MSLADELLADLEDDEEESMDTEELADLDNAESTETTDNPSMKQKTTSKKTSNFKALYNFDANYNNILCIFHRYFKFCERCGTFVSLEPHEGCVGTNQRIQWQTSQS